MNKTKIFLGIVVFGSIWGLLECVLGSYLPGGVLTGMVALGLMATARYIYRQKGMQLGMGLVAAALRAFNPLGGCVICSVIAIAMEGAVFELLWLAFSPDIEKVESITLKVSLGIVTAYTCYNIAYIMSQIITPLLFSAASLHFSNLVAFIPTILSRGLVAGVMGGVVFPVVAAAKQVELSFLKSKWQYSLGSMASAVCWLIVMIFY